LGERLDRTQEVAGSSPASSILDFAYQHGPHRRQMDRYRATNNADRTSFTRFTVLRSQGTWYGADPFA
jgi:hypothetical protein